MKEHICRTTCEEEVAISAANIQNDSEALKRVSREIYNSVERLGAVKVKEYVILRTAKASILVDRVLQRIELDKENLELRRALERLDNIKEAVRDIQQRVRQPLCPRTSQSILKRTSLGRSSLQFISSQRLGPRVAKDTGSARSLLPSERFSWTGEDSM